MADTFNTTTTLNGLFKEVYGETVENVVPGFAKLQKMIPFEQAKMVGKQYHQPVLLTHEHGITYSKPNNGAFTLEDSVPAVMKDAVVEPSQLVIKSTMDYESAFRSAQGGKRAFADGTGLLVKNMVESLSKRLEMDLLYGQKGMGAVNAATSSTATFVISEATWSAAIWAGLKGAHIHIINSDLAADEDTDEIITGITLSSRSIVVTNVQTLDAGDLVYFKGQVESGGTPVHHSMVGIDKIATVTTGSLFGITVTDYPDVWQATELTSTGQVSMAKILNGVSYAVNRGCMEDLVCLLSPKAFEVLNTDMAALRRIDNSYRFSKAESGSESLAFYGQNGKLELVPHLFVKDGDIFIIPPKRLKRIGSTEQTFKRPGGEDIFREATSAAGFELRAYTAQALFCERPSWMVKLSGVTYA